MSDILKLSLLVHKTNCYYLFIVNGLSTKMRVGGGCPRPLIQASNDEYIFVFILYKTYFHYDRNDLKSSFLYISSKVILYLKLHKIIFGTNGYILKII